MQLKHVVNIDNQKKSVVLLLYGEIGSKIDGDYFANEINYLSDDYDEIEIRINSGGGSVLQGLSIVNAILNSKAYIITKVEGLAASMAGVIAMAGNSVKMNDFARIMVHNPSFGDNSKLSNKEKKALEHLKDMLSTLLSRRGFDKDQMSALMEKETWFTAEEALQMRLVDEIIKTGKSDQVNNLLSATASITPETFSNFLQIKNQSDMKSITNELGLAENSTEAQIAVQIKTLKDENVALKASVAELEKTTNELKAEKEASQKKEVEKLTDNAIASGLYAKEQREDLIKMGTASFETFATMLNSMKKPENVSLTAVLNAQSSTTPEDPKKDFEWYRRNDPQALAEMKLTNRAQFDKLYADWEKINS